MAQTKQLSSDDVLRAYLQCGKSQSQTARLLGLARSTVQHHLARVAIPDDNPVAQEAPKPAELPPPDLPFEERLELMKRRNQVRIERAMAEMWHTVRIPLAGPYGLLLFGDPHLDDPYCDLAAIEAHAEVARKTEALYGFNGGDSVNNWVGRLERLHGEQNVTTSEAWELVDWFMNRLGIRWLAWLLGNHDTWNNGYHIIAKTNAQRIVMRDYDAKLRLVSPCGGVATLWARHDFKGTSIYNELHGLKRAAMHEEEADIYAAFHRHTFAQGQGELPGGREYCIVRARGYKEVDFHAVRHQFHTQRAGQSVVLVIEPRLGAKPIVQAFRDVHRGADYLTMIREQWKVG